MQLLNLYIDGEIPPTLAAELEAEIIANPKRRKVYDEYCRIHRATKEVYERFREAAVSPDIARVRLFEPTPIVPGARSEALKSVSRRRSVRTAVLSIGGVAAALVVGVIAVQSVPQADTDVVPVVATSTPENVVHVATVAEETVIAAPFAAETRADPYVAQEPATRSSPFTLSSNPADLHFVWPSGELEGASKIQSPFGMVRLELAPIATAPVLSTTEASAETAKSSGIFRSSASESSPQLQPASLSGDR
ncbi:hypothetical protein ASA1KI_30780 [Opitutales bacterium ASA1]|uniref:hypothetical protein n=1 Tax=Congregicoccus parvus TaxID=3081749 RepID=UPI002B282A7F|nr:hypothetical protein ASA1KI_30780 [Opitutales bacterium ASA1]